jgi:dTDP-4-dehydrorhamnose reductase
MPSEKTSASEKSRGTRRVLVLGATGMLGHKLVQQLAAHGLSVFGTMRSSSAPDTPAARVALGVAEKVLHDVDVLQDGALQAAIEMVDPDVVVNAVGVIKQIGVAKDPVTSIATNALLPHRAAGFCSKRGTRLIQFSTDCVFAGRKGPYAENAPTDAEDLYGRSKILGEVSGSGRLTIRSSIVGRELRGRSSLIEWFLSQRGGQATGFTGALYTGLTTNVMSDLVAKLITEHPQLDGVWHVASDPISKHELLQLVNNRYELGISLRPDDKFFCDRRLDGRAFTERTGFTAPSWDVMIARMHDDPTPYDAPESADA